SVENQYARIVREDGNLEAQKVINEVFEVRNQMWRGIGEIPESGYAVREKYAEFDAAKKYNVTIDEAPENPDCISGQIMKGIKKPFECSQFGKKCKPTNPLGAPMVSSEGACAAYYHFSGLVEA
ncbi:MAG TPA: hydrogenase formation protein HypD, partial [Maribacter sp.]|nr:hydrogenase formation protein HypD [Maribacter sp.]